MSAEPESTFNAKIVCDLTPFGRIVAECDANIEFGPSDDPQSVEISVSASRQQIVSLYSQPTLELGTYFGATSFSGEMVETGVKFKGIIARLLRMQPVDMFEGVRLTCAIDDFEFLAVNEGAGKVSIFRLTNVPYRLQGDVPIARPVRKAAPTPLETDFFATQEVASLSESERKAIFKPGYEFSVSRINFTYGGVAWSLDRTHDNAIGKAAHLLPMVTATLATTSPGDDEHLELLADHICDLLTFALGKEIQWVSRGRFSETGPLQSRCRSFPLLPYGKGDGPVVDNWEFGNLQQFLHECESEFEANAKWWHTSIGLLAHARSTSLLEIRLSTFNTLLDRVSKKSLDAINASEIDSKLPVRLERRLFQCALHRLLCLLSTNWSRERTDAVCTTIKQWNSSPSFPNQVCRACEELGITPPPKKQLGIRHKLIHVGEFEARLTREDIVSYIGTVEPAVELMMIRQLGFTGLVHIDPKEQRWRKVEDSLQFMKQADEDTKAYYR